MIKIFLKKTGKEVRRKKCTKKETVKMKRQKNGGKLILHNLRQIYTTAFLCVEMFILNSREK